MKFLKSVLMVSALSVTASLTLLQASGVKVEQPDATKILQKDALKAPAVHKMPANCISNDPKVIAIGHYIFHNLNGKKAKAKAPEGLAKFVEKNGKKKPKQYGNCVACHNIEGAIGAGNIGPDLHKYKANFIDTKVRDYQYVYQQIADSRVHDKDSRMTINLTTGLFTPQEVCAVTSYIVSEKK
jgi:sulfur-oxidizing protein SoxX